MLQQDFEQLKDFILLRNTYFSAGFANAYKDDTTHAVWVRQGGDMKRLLPADTLGNYFYLRNDAWMKYEAKEPERMTDTGTQRLTFLDTMSVQLVAVVNNADAYKLIENLRNTALAYAPLNVVPVTASWNREQVVATELAKMRMEDVNAALQRLKDETIIRLSLSVSKTFIPVNCISEPF
ncbi:MAG TPA: hypothetical protein VIN07_11170 [Flavipsychrobacter sp.]